MKRSQQSLYHAAYVNWGSQWTMPTKNDMDGQSAMIIAMMANLYVLSAGNDEQYKAEVVPLMGINNI